MLLVDLLDLGPNDLGFLLVPVGRGSEHPLPEGLSLRFGVGHPCRILGGANNSLQHCYTSKNTDGHDTSPPWQAGPYVSVLDKPLHRRREAPAKVQPKLLEISNGLRNCGNLVHVNRILQ